MTGNQGRSSRSPVDVREHYVKGNNSHEMDEKGLHANTFPIISLVIPFPRPPLPGPSLLSPAFKSLALQHADDRQLRSRGQVIAVLESRLRFLGASASGVLAGRLPPYRAVLLDLRRRLAVPCHPRLSTQDLEAEIFVHLVARQGSWLRSAGPAGRLRRAASIATGKDARLTVVDSSTRWSPVQIAVGCVRDAAVPLSIAARGSLRFGSEAAALALLGRAWSGALLQRLPAEVRAGSGGIYMRGDLLFSTHTTARLVLRRERGPLARWRGWPPAPWAPGCGPAPPGTSRPWRSAQTTLGCAAPSFFWRRFAWCEPKASTCRARPEAFIVVNWLTRYMFGGDAHIYV